MASDSATSVEPVSTRNPWRLAALIVGGAAWALFVAMAVRTSRFPVVLHRYSKEYAALMVIVVAAAAILTIVQSPRIFSIIYARRHTLIWLGVFCPVLIFASAEAAMRAFNLLGSDFYGEIRRYMTILVLDDLLYFKNPAGYRGAFEGVEISTNEIGLRDRLLKPRVPGVH